VDRPSVFLISFFLCRHCLAHRTQPQSLKSFGPAVPLSPTNTGLRALEVALRPLT
jgi:hypothetical protein